MVRRTLCVSAIAACVLQGCAHWTHEGHRGHDRDSADPRDPKPLICGTDCVVEVIVKCTDNSCKAYVKHEVVLADSKNKSITWTLTAPQRVPDAQLQILFDSEHGAPPYDCPSTSREKAIKCAKQTSGVGAHPYVVHINGIRDVLVVDPWVVNY